MYKIAVFVSGRGSNLKSIIESGKKLNYSYKVSAVVSDKIDCPAFEIAGENKIPAFSVASKQKENFTTYSELISIFSEMEIELIVLAGFLKKIPDELILKYQNKIINIHPALLPSFGGKGMYGINVHKAVFEKSCKVSGVTIHFVDSVYDNGKIIAQECTGINDVKSPEEIAESVLKIEHKLYPQIINKFSEGKVTIVNNRVEVNN